MARTDIAVNRLGGLTPPIRDQSSGYEADRRRSWQTGRPIKPQSQPQENLEGFLAVLTLWSNDGRHGVHGYAALYRSLANGEILCDAGPR